MKSSVPLEFNESCFEAGDGERLFARCAKVREAVRAEVLLTHGLGEHSGRYRHVAEVFAARGLCAYDLRGHGRSGGRRGDAARYEMLLDDLGFAAARVAHEERPVFLLGHSLGGQIALNYLLRTGAVCRGAVIASPWLRLAFAPARWRVALGRAALRIWPGWRQGTDVSWSRLSRDAEHRAALPEPELLNHTISARFYFAIERAATAAMSGAPQLRTPLLLLHGGDDPVTSMAATQEFHARAGSADKTILIYPDARHETHNDLCRDQVIDDIARWIEARAGA